MEAVIYYLATLTMRADRHLRIIRRTATGSTAAGNDDWYAAAAVAAAEWKWWW